LTARISFLGTGASGGTPGHGRSRRLESSLLVEDDLHVLIDVTRHFPLQARAIERIDAVLLTHAHRDACGGIPKLRRWLQVRGAGPVPVYASGPTIRALRSRLERLDHCDFVPVGEDERRRLGSWTLTAHQVPHALEARYPTFAWKLRRGKKALVYASDVARLTAELERFSRGAAILVIDGAMWGRRLFSHLTIDEALPELCRWNVGQIVLTQIGKTVPPHDEAKQQVAARCPRARPAYDGMTLHVP
jgi:phosphoribosyl 1,2-cyclic phosphodiesterase